MDSASLAERLEQDYSTRSMHLDALVITEVAKIIPKIQEELRAVWIPQVPEKLLNPICADYFFLTREKKFGKVT